MGVSDEGFQIRISDYSLILLADLDTLHFAP